MSYKYQKSYSNEVLDYKAKCALAEKLGDVTLRQWCVEQLGVRIGADGDGLDFGRVAALFEYIKGNRNTS